MVALNLPPFDVRLRPGQIFDPLRRKWVALTPEEWVRQHFAAYLVGFLGCPAGLTANEVTLRVGTDVVRRCDTVVYDRFLRPVAVVEYKAPDVAVTRRVFDQIVRYNTALHAPCIMVSNGLRHYAAAVGENGKATLLGELPSYDVLCRMV